MTKDKKPRTPAQLLASTSNWQKGRLHRIEGAIKYELDTLRRSGLNPNHLVCNQLRQALDLVRLARSNYTVLVDDALAKHRKEKEDSKDKTK